MKLYTALIALLSLVTPVNAAESGIASIYGYKGGRTASGAHVNNNALTAASRHLPFGTSVRVTNRRNGRSVVVSINDRGPWVRGRIIDLTPRAARAIGMNGLGNVKLDTIAYK